jgi:hypothetical protein
VLQAQFGMCSSANPVVLLRLFPSLAPEALLSPVLHLFAGAAGTGPCIVILCRLRL